MADPLNVLSGTLDVLVLKALSWAPMRGFEITQWHWWRPRSRAPGATPAAPRRRM